MRKRCPLCRFGAWDADQFGRLTCPNCKTQYKVGRATISPIVSWRKITNAPRANRDSIMVNGQVLCACCQRPFPLAETVDGRLETDGTRKVRSQVGWTVEAGNVLVPSYMDRTIPRLVRGMLCLECMNDYNGHPVGKPIVKAPIVHIEALDADIRNNGYPKDRDPDPTWAYTGSSEWLRANAYSVSFDWTQRYIEQHMVARSIAETGWLSGLGRHPLPFWLRSPMQHKRLFPVLPSPDRKRTEHSRLSPWQWLKPTHADGYDLVAAVKAAIDLGDGQAAAKYARMAVRHIVGLGL